MGKFGFYEIFKDVFKNSVGEENAIKYRWIGWSIASGSAEFIADMMLCPFEATKVRVQTMPEGTFPYKFSEAFGKVKGEYYKGIYPLWGRQIPYTIVKFVAFE